MNSWKTFFKSLPEVMFIELRERERNIDVGEEHQSVASHMHPDQGLDPHKLRYVP